MGAVLCEAARGPAAVRAARGLKPQLWSVSLGMAKGTCTVVEDGLVCGDDVECKGMCHKHYVRNRVHGDPLKVAHRRGEDHPSWKGDDVDLGAQHYRVRAARGTPSFCEHCKTTDPSLLYDWAFNNSGDRLNVDDYIRLCRKCHKVFDAEFASRGSGHGGAKLTEADIPVIIRRRREGEEQKQIAVSLGVSDATISMIIAGRTWRHVPR
jgi:hypothetical protein